MNQIPSKFNLAHNIIVHRQPDYTMGGDRFIISREIESDKTACEVFCLDHRLMAGSEHITQTFIAEEVAKHIDIMMNRLTSGYAI